jgi:deazaflavin-dependent oxidoreductase (nitroreductase family)
MNALTPLAIRIGGLSWLPRFLRQITAVDKLIQRVTRGRWSLLRLAGLPGLMLTVVGRRSGISRRTPVLFVPYGAGQLIAGSNFGGPKQPAWVGNLRAAGRATVTVDGLSRDVVARELSGAEREAAWAQLLRTWPNYARYAERTSRVIPVFRLDPAR